MEAFLGGLFLFIGIPGSILLAVLLVIYFMEASESEDWLFFIRKIQFKRKLRKLGFENTWGFLGTLLTTTWSDWKKNGEAMSYNAFPNTKVIVRVCNDDKIVFSIREGTGYEFVLFLEFYYGRNNGQLSCPFDLLTKTYINQTDAFEVKQILLYLKEIFDGYDKVEKEQERLAKEQKTRTHENDMQQKKEQLLTFLAKPLSPSNTWSEQGFCATKLVKEAHQTLTISYGDTVYFQALFLSKTAKLTSTFHHTNEQYAPVFVECQNELESFAKKVLASDVFVKEANENLLPSSFEQQYKEYILLIQKLLTQLNEDEEWLGMESVHYITENVPNDLEALREIHFAMHDKKRVASEITASLLSMLQKLEDIVEEGESNKVKEAQKRQLIVEKRIQK